MCLIDYADVKITFLAQKLPIWRCSVHQVAKLVIYDYAWHFLMRNEESRNLMTRNSSQGKQTRKTRNSPAYNEGFLAKIGLKN